MLQEALKDAVDKTGRNIIRFGGKFPHVSEQGVYRLNVNSEWTEGFWTGMLWLCYEHSGEERFRTAARAATEVFRERLAARQSLEHHDIGFLYSLSAKAQWMVDGDPEAKELAIGAADALMERWRPGIGIIQAWGAEGDKENGGRIIIDCLMNLPLLFWASKHTGDPRYAEAAVRQAEKSRRFLVRGDSSSYHTFFFDQVSGEAIRGGTAQGYSDGSTWTRGQAWGIYGFALAYHYTGDTAYRDTSLRLAEHFLERIPDDGVAYWDFCAPIDADTKRDSSASAIAACGIHQLLLDLPVDHGGRELLENGLNRSVEGLIRHCATVGQSDAEGLLMHGSYNVRGNTSPDDYMIWGDYFYLEALMRLTAGHTGYWYE